MALAACAAAHFFVVPAMAGWGGRIAVLAQKAAHLFRLQRALVAPALIRSLCCSSKRPAQAVWPTSHAGSVKRVGRCDAYATEFDLEAEEYVPLPKGDVHKKKSVVQVDSGVNFCALPLTSSFDFKMQHCRRIRCGHHKCVASSPRGMP